MNEFDIFPRRNLPPESEEWGRTVEDRIYDILNGSVGDKQAVDGLNRTSASTLQDLAKQLEKLGIQVERINDLYEQLPKAYQANSNPTAFSVLGSGWRNIAAVTFTAPATGTFTIAASSVGRLQTSSSSTNVEVSYRLVTDGTASPVINGIYWSPEGEFQNTWSLSWGWSVNAIEGEDISVAIQANPVGTTTWASHPATYASLQASATFTG